MKRICYIVDGINFVGGAHVATANLLAALERRGCAVDVLTDEDPTAWTRGRFSNLAIRRWTWPSGWFARNAFLAYRLMTRSCRYPDWMIDRSGAIRSLLSDYDCVCVMSECSPLRGLVSRLPSRIRKVQMIHTDYAVWRRASRFTRLCTRGDGELYQAFDAVAVVGAANAEAFASLYPELRSKTRAFRNLLDVREPIVRRKPSGRIRIVTVSRCDEVQKASSRAVRIACRLLRAGVDLDWTFIGSGYEALAKEVADSGFASRIHFPGVAQNPSAELGRYDLMALLSRFEGVPMVVCEALMAGLPVVATAVGGLAELVAEGRSGWLLPDDEESIVSAMTGILRGRRLDELGPIGLAYDHEAVLRVHLELLGLSPDRSSNGDGMV